MNRELLDHWCERAMLGLVLAVLVFGPLALGAVRATEFVVLQWLLLALLAVWLVRLWIAPSYRFLLPPTAWAVLPFVAYAAWRYRTADIEYVARQEFIQVAMAAVLFLAIVNNLYGQTEIRVMTVCLIFLGTVVAMYGIYQWLSGSNHVWKFLRPGYEGRGSGTYISPNHLAGFLEMICPLAMAFTLLRGFGPVARICFAYASFVMLVGIAATGSRGGWLAAGAGVLLVAGVLIRKKSHFWAALALLLIVGGTGKWFYARTLESRMYQNPVSHQYDDIRFRIWTAARQMWVDHPWVGVGPAHFDERFRGYRIPRWEVQNRPGYAHNDYWNTLADWGLFGLVLVLAPIVAAGAGVVISWRYLRRARETTGSRISVVLGASAGLFALLVHSFFDFNMHIPANAFLAAALLAMITTHWRFASQRFWITARWPVRIAGTLVLAGAGAYLGEQTVRHTSEAWALRQADLALTSKEKTAALQKAFQIEPQNAETAYSIGEQIRLQAWLGEDDNQQLAGEALGWHTRAIGLNRWDPHARISAGMCLDWLGRHEEAGPYFTQALQLDPNQWFVRGMMGWHYFQMENFAETQRWMERSLELNGAYNSLATTYHNLAKKSLASPGNAGSPFQPIPKPR